MTEAYLERRFAALVRKAGGHAVKMVAIEAGTPDRLVLASGGRIYLVELKTDEGRLRPIQRVWHERAAQLGTEVIVLRGMEEIEQWVRTL